VGTIIGFAVGATVIVASGRDVGFVVNDGASVNEITSVVTSVTDSVATSAGVLSGRTAYKGPK
jgi:arginine exporter protein ArgO